MGVEDIPEEVARFISDHIHSVEQLEALLLLRSARDRAWSADEVSRELTTTTGSAEARLLDLAARRFVVMKVGEPPLYRYAPAKPEVDSAVEILSQIYKQRRVSLIQLIYSKPKDAVRAFSDSFRLKKDA